MPENTDYSEDLNNFYLNEQNKKKKKLLEEKYGMVHSDFDSNASPELMNNYLNYIVKFEDSFENAETKKIKEILGFPKFKNIFEIEPSKLIEETDLVLDIYENHSFNIDVIEKNDVTDEEFYRFLTEELPEEETQFINIEGMITNYIYEEFHPNLKLDAKNTIETFLTALIFNDTKEMALFLKNNKVLFNGSLLKDKELINELTSRIPLNPGKNNVLFKNFEINSLVKADIDFFILYKDNIPGINTEKKIKLSMIFILEKCEYGLFTITEIVLNNP